MSAVALKNILIAEDNNYNAETFAAQLQCMDENNFKIVVAMNEEEALKAVDGKPFDAWQIDDEFQLVQAGLKTEKVWHAFFLDGMMPHLGRVNERAGVEIAKKARVKFPEAKIFSYSGSSLPEYKDPELYDAELKKPISASVLKSQLLAHNLLVA